MAADGEKALSRYLRDEVVAHSPYYRRLSQEGGDAWSRGIDDLSRLPLLRLDEIEDPAEFVLRPDWTSLKRRRRREAGELVDHRYKPVHWTLDDGVLVGSSVADMQRLAGLGARWLALAGVGPTDVLVGLALPGPNLSFWELVVGAREAGVSAIHLPPAATAAEVVRLCPTVLAGRPFDLARLLASARAEGNPLVSVHTLLVLGEPLEDGLRAKLLQLLESPEQGAVVAAWAPPGVRSLWSECHQAGGATTASPASGRSPGVRAAAATGTVGGTGLHTWPETEVLEVIDPLSGTSAPPGADGEVVWTALGWSGTVFVRLRTGVFGTLEDGPCPACDRPGARLSIVSDTPAFLTALDRHPEVTGWQAELRTVEGSEELIVFISLAPEAAAGSVMPELDDQLSATQYVVVDAPTLDARLVAHDDRRVVDLRRR